MRWTRTPALLLAAALPVVAAACGSSSPTPTASPPASQPATTTTTIASISMPSTAGTFGTAPPAVTLPAGAPPTVLESADLITGTGAAAKAGDTVDVQYVLVDYSTDKQVSTSWGGSEPFSFTLDATPEQVIKGWDEGVVGMKVGGRRELIIPPALGYGTMPPANSGIEKNATLVFIVDLLKIQ